MVDITPIIPADRQVIDTYGPGIFRVANTIHRTPLIVFPDRTLPWSPPAFEALSVADFAPVVERAAEVGVVLLGCGPRMLPVPRALRQAVRDAGIVMDPMDTGAACRTYNVLLAEGRRVAAVLYMV
jgi:uncharacterized protein